MFCKRILDSLTSESLLSLINNWYCEISVGDEILKTGNNVLIVSWFPGDKNETSVTVKEKILLHGPGVVSGFTRIFQ